MGHRLEGGGSVEVRGWDRRDEARRLREHPGAHEASGRVDDAGRADHLADGLLRSVTRTKCRQDQGSLTDPAHHRPLSLIEFVQLAFEAGYRTEAKSFPNLILAALQKLTARGTFVK